MCYRSPVSDPPLHQTLQMSENGTSKSGVVAPDDRVAIGITFGNSNSSIAYTVDDKAEVIANEDGGKSRCVLWW